jgi:hypothetical protein
VIFSACIKYLFGLLVLRATSRTPTVEVSSVAMTRTGIDGWQTVLQEMATQWDNSVLETQSARVFRWSADLEAFEAEERRLRVAGRWLTGRSDWLGILARERHEMTHSRLLGWLCDPSGQQGLGTTFLQAFLELVESPYPSDPSATVSLELDGSTGLTRADVVIDTPRGRVVIENKIDAAESPKQCFKLAQDHPELAHLVLLSPGLDSPLTAGPSLPRWKAVKWRQVGRALVECLPSATGPGRYIVIEYAATLRRIFG